ncbi:MAG: recombinase family protein [Fimbriimonadaceae bacterium]|nr:recombinase family protein [Fimbriimonadaceae bacterium]
MLNYGIYTRKSDDDRSVTEKSIREQLAECQHLVERSGLKVVRTWEESRSARHPNRRTGYRELISAIEAGEVQGVVCWHVNRLVRNMEEGGKLAQLLIEGTLKEIQTPSAIYRTGDNIMPLVIEAASATQFSLDHAKAVSRGLEGSFRSGGCTNKAPQGYRNVRDPLNLKRGLIERDPERFDVVRRTWELLIHTGCTLKQATRTMNDVWGFRTRPTRNAGNRPLSYSGAYFMFTNPFYAGFVHRKGELVKGNHEPMVTADEFERVQANLKRGSFSAPRVKEYAYTGLMRCAHCGQQITGEVKRLRDGRLWENYHCSDANLRCTKKGLSRERVEKLIFGELAQLEIEPTLLDAAKENILRHIENSPGSNEAILQSQQAELEECEKRIRRLSDIWLDGVMTDPERYRELEARELERKSEITFEMERLRHQIETSKVNLTRSIRFLKDARSFLKSADADVKKKIFRALATSYVFDGHAKSITTTIHPLLIEMVSYARKFKRLEPQKIGSGSKRKLPLAEAVFVGGDSKSGLESIARLKSALNQDAFPYTVEDTDNDWDE